MFSRQKPSRRQAGTRPLRVESLEPRVVLASGPVISEFLAANGAGILDDDGERSDWVEIHNQDNAPLDLAGWHLTDDAGDLRQWTFPAVTIEAGAYLVVFASGKNRTNPASPLHANFQLARTGEFLALVDPAETIVSQFDPNYPEQRSDISFGTLLESPRHELVSTGSNAQLLLPQSAEQYDSAWVDPAFFADGLWQNVALGIGYDTDIDDGGEPIALPVVDGLVYHLDAAAGVELLDGLVAEWHDRSGAERDFSQSDPAKRPQWVADAIGGLPALRFDGDNANASAAADELLLASSTNPQTFFAVTTAAAGGGLRGIWGLENGDKGIRLSSVTDYRGPTAGSDGNDFGNGDPQAVAVNGQLTTAYTVGSPHILREFRGPNHAGGVYGVTSIGSYFNGRSYQGDVAEIIVFDRLLSAVEENAVGYYLAEKYGLDSQYLRTTPPTYDEFYTTDIKNEMFGVNATALVRAPFQVDDPTALDRLLFQARYDDGFALWLNGQPVAQRNAPATLGWNSAASDIRDDTDAIQFEEIDLSPFIALLVPGENVLAIHALNGAADDADFLLDAKLIALEAERTELRYFLTPTPGKANRDPLLGFVADTTFSVDRGFYSEAFEVAITTATPDAQIYYTTDGSAPGPTNGTLYSGPLPISATTVLRAVAQREGYLSSNSDTQSYFFIEDVIQQTDLSTLAAGFPAIWNGTTPTTADYGLDPDVVAQDGSDLFDGLYAATIRDDLVSIPTLSIVSDIDDIFGPTGIYANPLNDALEVATSFELVYPDGTPGFQINAGLKIQGGAFRGFGLTKKKSLRLKFNEDYGPTKLSFPLFGDDAAAEFDTITLRMESNDGWQWSGAGARPQYARDEFGRQSQLALGQPAGHGANFHVYINGVYWGVYDAVERPDNSFAATYFGGAKEEWDVQNSGEAIDGDLVSWNMLRTLAQAVADAATVEEREAAYQKILGNNPDGSRNPAWEVYLDVDNYIDYLLVNWYGGNSDWPNKNYYAGRRRGPESEGFKFFMWDSEWSLNLQSSVTTNRLSDFRGIAEPYGLIRASTEFQLRFADRVERAFLVPGGTFYVDPANPAWDPEHPERNEPAARYFKITEPLASPLVAESARWGDQHRTSLPYTVQADWLPERNNLLANYFPLRSANVLEDLVEADFYPSFSAPAFTVNGSAMHGGQVTAADDVGLAADAGTIYYSLDGSDPRLVGDAVSPTAFAFVVPFQLPQTATVRARLLTTSGEWSALAETTFFVNTPAAAGNLAITEINYHPLDPSSAELLIGPAFTANDFEFIEIQNISDSTLDLTGVHFSQGVAFDFDLSSTTTLQPGEFAVVARNVFAFETRYGDAITPLGEFSDSGLSDSGETIELADRFGSVIVSIPYSDGAAWPSRPDGRGSSLEIIAATADPAKPENWRAGSEVNGSPGFAGAGPDRRVVINEILAHTDGELTDSIEFLNPTGAAVDISGWTISDSANPLVKFLFPAGTTIDAGGYLVVDEHDFNATGLDTNPTNDEPLDFGLSSAHGERLYLIEAEEGVAKRFIDDVEFTGTADGVSLGRWPNGSGELFPLRGLTFGQANAAPLLPDVLITEVHYHSDELGADDLEFVEIHNTLGRPVDLTGWRIQGGVDFDFPAGLLLPANTSLAVLSFNPEKRNSQGELENGARIDAFRLAHGISEQALLVGGYGGQLNNGGASLRLERSDEPPQDEPAFTPHLLVDRAVYDDQSPWPAEADGGGSSLERVWVDSFGDFAASWVAADPSPGNYDGLASTLQVASVVARETAVEIQLLRDLDWSLINLYDGPDSAIDLPDVSLIGAASGTVRGSLVYDAPERRLQFIPADGPLAADVYTLRLASRADGLVEMAGDLLDGNRDGQRGDDFVSTFTIESTNARRLSLPSIALGPGQSVGLQGPTVLPVAIDNAANVRHVTFELWYDSTALSLVSVRLATNMPADWSVDEVTLLAPGRLRVTLSGDTVLASGSRNLVELVAVVPTTANLGDVFAVRIESVELNGGDIDSQGARAVFAVAFRGDVSMSGDFSALDASWTARVAVGLDTGFDQLAQIDPRIVADVTGDGTLSALDASFIARKAVRLDQPEIPDIPAAAPSPAPPPTVNEIPQPNPAVFVSAPDLQNEPLPTVEQQPGVDEQIGNRFRSSRLWLRRVDAVLTGWNDALSHLIEGPKAGQIAKVRDGKLQESIFEDVSLPFDLKSW